MNGDHGTAGDYAWDAARSAQAENDRLSNRVSTLERELEDIKVWSKEVADTVNTALDVLGIEEAVRQRLMS